MASRWAVITIQVCLENTNFACKLPNSTHVLSTFEDYINIGKLCYHSRTCNSSQQLFLFLFPCSLFAASTKPTRKKKHQQQQQQQYLYQDSSFSIDQSYLLLLVGFIYSWIWTLSASKNESSSSIENQQRHFSLEPS